MEFQLIVSIEYFFGRLVVMTVKVSEARAAIVHVVCFSSEAAMLSSLTKSFLDRFITFLDGAMGR